MNAHFVRTTRRIAFFPFAIAMMLASSVGITSDAIKPLSLGDCSNSNPPDEGFYFRINPYCATVEVGDVIDIEVQISTAGHSIRGGATVVDYDNTVFEIVGGAAGFTKAPESPFNLSPAPMLVDSTIQVPFLYLAFNLVAYEGSLFTFKLKALAPVSNTSLTFNISNPTASTRVSPALPDPAAYGSAEFTILSAGRSLGDFDSSGCTDLADFLYLLDNWETDLEGSPLGVSDCLALLDNWLLGPDC